MEFRALNADEIDVRVQNIAKDSSGVILLLYKDARVDMNILDETVGCENWQREHYECKGNLFCKVGIRTKSGDWVWKSDCGIESNAEAKKGEASDSFKRACFNVGIGRELYGGANAQQQMQIPQGQPVAPPSYSNNSAQFEELKTDEDLPF